jgi:hypothetical protein
MMAFGLRGAGCATVIVLLPMSAQAVTWNIDFGIVQSTFEAPEGGGLVSGLVVTFGGFGGLEFNSPEAGDNAPVFDPVENHFEPVGGGLFSYFLNPAHSALLEFETRVDPFTPPNWQVFDPQFGDVLAFGHYEITPGPAPIPLPAPLALMAAAAGALGLLGLRRRGARP